MDIVQHIPKTELARNTRQIIQSVQRGQTVVIDNHGQPEAAIVDIMDYYLLRAVLNFLIHTPPIQENGLDNQTLPQAPQERVDLVINSYLQEQISLEKTANLLNLSWFDLRNRLIRLGLPMVQTTLDDDIANAQAFSI